MDLMLSSSESAASRLVVCDQMRISAATNGDTCRCGGENHFFDVMEVKMPPSGVLSRMTGHHDGLHLTGVAVNWPR